MAHFFIGGDWRFFWPENIKDFIHLPSAWDSILNTGLGVASLNSLWVTSYLNFTSLFSAIGLSWKLISLIFWFLPAVLVSFFSSFFLCKKILSSLKAIYSILAGIIYAANTYFLMILGGGQLGVALAYSLVPLVFLLASNQIDSPSLKKSIIFGLVIALQMLFDPRFVYVILIAILIYWLFNLRLIKKLVLNLLLVFIIPFAIVLLFHSYWILPALFTRSSLVPSGFDSLSGLKFLSFTDLSHSLSLLHPNWPENIFGKVYFMRSEFIILPFLAYLSLFFIKKGQRKILFFAFLGILGAFLTKGNNAPLGNIYVWLFQKVPGFVVFRDSTKFYSLVALSYAILIPFSLERISQYSLRIHRIIYYLIPFVFLFFWLFTIKPTIFGSINTALKPRAVPIEYIQLKDFLFNQKNYFRTLWIPQWQRFGYFSDMHPAIGREELIKGNLLQQLNEFRKPESKFLLQSLSVKYIVVPFDSESEIFLGDRKYDEKAYKNTVEALKEISWLKEIKSFGKIVVFEVPNPLNHFYISSASTVDLGKVTYIGSDTKYEIAVENIKKGDLLVFSEGYDKSWQTEIPSGLITSKLYDKLLNSFVLPKDGSYSLEVYYKPQMWVNMGLAISSATLIIAGIVLLCLRKRE